MLLDSFLLNTFAKNFNFNPNITSVRQRYRVLSLMITNFLIFFVLLVYAILQTFYFDNVNNYLMFSVCCIFMPLSFLSLHRGNDGVAVGLTLCQLHLINVVGGSYQNMPLTAICSLTIFPNYLLLLGVSLKSMALNIFICFLHFTYYLFQAKASFQITLNDDQAFQISSLLISSFLFLLQICLICVGKLVVENDIWKLAEINFEKSESLTKEVIKVVEARDAFVFSLSYEMKNSLYSINECLDYLTQGIKHHSHLETLRNIKLNCEVLNNMVNNILDASSLRHNQAEVSNTSTKIVQIAEKAFSIHIGIMRTKNISIEAFIDKSVPKEIWIDSSRLLQIFINLISNALKYTSCTGKINVYAKWYSENTEQENLLKPIINPDDQRSFHRERNHPPDTTEINNFNYSQEGLEEFSEIGNC